MLSTLFTSAAWRENRDLKRPRRVWGRRREYSNGIWVENVVNSGKYFSKLRSIDEVKKMISGFVEEIRELPLLSFENNTISDEEVLLLSGEFKSKMFLTKTMWDSNFMIWTNVTVWRNLDFKSATFLFWKTFYSYQTSFCATKDHVQVELRGLAFCWNGFHIPADIVIWMRALASPFRSEVWSVIMCRLYLRSSQSPHT